MNLPDFLKVGRDFVETILKRLESKNREYASMGDVFAAFRRAGSLLGSKMETALIGMMSKHLTSMVDVVHRIERGEKVDTAFVDEKLGDVLAYLLLLRGMIHEREKAESVVVQFDDGILKSNDGKEA